MHTQYGTWVQKHFLGKRYWGTARTTFVIDAAGKIAHIIHKVKPSSHAAQVLAMQAHEAADTEQ